MSRVDDSLERASVMASPPGCALPAWGRFLRQDSPVRGNSLFGSLEWPVLTLVEHVEDTIEPLKLKVF